MTPTFDFLTHLPAIVPEVAMTVLALLVLLIDLRWKGEQRRGIGIVAGLGLLTIAITPFIWPPTDPDALYWGGMVRYDVLAQIFKITVILAGALCCLIAVDTTELGRKGEYYLIIVVSTLGASLMSAAADLIMVFVALETLSIPLYMLASFSRKDKRSSEAGVKYFLFGSFASAIMLYGFSLLFGLTGQTNLYAIGAFLGSESFTANAAPVLITLVFIVVGFGFKISAAPFHFWTPDVYEGSPIPVTAFVSVASKAASMALLMRFFTAVFPADLTIGTVEVQSFWINLAAWGAVASMTVGNVIALVQKNFKRMLAYSSIAQAGYALIGVAAIQAGTAQSVASVAFYLFMYIFTNLLAFGVVARFSEIAGGDDIKDLAGLSRRSPMLALAITIGLLSLAGIPPAAGFIGKFFLFNAAVDANLTWLAIVGVLNAIVGLYYYLVVVKVIYVDRGAHDEHTISIPAATGWTLAIASVVVLLLGTVGAQAVYDWALTSAATLLY
jgi:NADH-quinone oxidoreductase subunit N